MDRLDMAIALLTEAKEERDRYRSYTKDYEDMVLRSSGVERMQEYAKLEKKYGRVPSKAVVNDNLKMARRLLLAEYM